MSPTTNSFFSNTTGFYGETNLIDDLVIEQIAIYGVDIMYLPQKLVTYDRFLNESTKSIFEAAMPIPMYIKTYSGYTNGMELLEKFGVRASDELTVVVSKSQFQAFYAPFLNTYYRTQNEADELYYDQGQTEYRPKEGDLIYFPFDDGLFEIKYVKVDAEFFQLGKNYTFELQLEKFEYTGEHFDTGIYTIDKQQAVAHFYKLEFLLESEGISSFNFNETVKIYNIEDPDFELPSVIGAQGPQNVENFKFYYDPGFLQNVPFVTAKVMKWDITDHTLLVAQLSDQDPTQRNLTTLEVNRNKLSNVLVIGEQSGAIYRAISAKTANDPFNDESNIQEEFDKIKIIDVSDEDPFGFI